MCVPLAACTCAAAAEPPDIDAAAKAEAREGTGAEADAGECEAAAETLAAVAAIFEADHFPWRTTIKSTPTVRLPLPNWDSACTCSTSV